MIPNLSLIQAHVVNATTPAASSGKGRVERMIDSATFVIRIAGRDITVAVAPGSLAVGDPVSLSAGANGQVLIRAESSASRQDAAMPQDRYDSPNRQAQQRLAIVVRICSQQLTDANQRPVTPESLAPLAREIERLSAGQGRAMSEAAAAFSQAVADAANGKADLQDPITRARIARFVEQLSRALPAEARSAAAAFAPAAAIVPQQFEESFRAFDSFDNLRAWLAKNGVSVPELFRRFENLPGMDLVLRTAALEGGGTELSVVRPADLTAEFRLLLQTMRAADFWRAIGPEPLMHYVADRGVLSIARVRGIDAFIADAAQESLLPFRGLTFDNARAAAVQWLSAVLDSGIPESVLPVASPLASAADLPGQVTAAAGSAGMPMPRTVEELLAAPPGPQSEIVPQMLRQLGLTLENEAAQAVRPSDLPQSLKALLLSLMGRLSANASAESVLGSRSGPASQTVAGPAPIAAENTGPADPDAPRVAALARSALADLEAVLQSVADPDRIAIPAFAGPAPANPPAVLPALQPMLQRLDTLATALMRLFGFAEKPVQDRSDASERLPARQTLQQAAASPAAAGRPEQPALLTGGSSAPRIGQAIRDLVRNLGDLAREVRQFSGSQLSAASQSGEERHAVARRAGDLIRTVRQQLQSIVAERAPGISQVADLAARFAAESALNKLEMLQMLARPAQTADGTQQILALPMKIGNEWTDVRVQLIKKRASGSKKKEGQKKYYVQVDAEPTALGAVQARLDYSPRRDLLIILSFARESSRRWFEGHSAAILSALGPVGGGRVRLNFEQIGAKEERHASASEPHRSDRTLDVRV